MEFVSIMDGTLVMNCLNFSFDKPVLQKVSENCVTRRVVHSIMVDGGGGWGVEDPYNKMMTVFIVVWLFVSGYIALFSCLLVYIYISEHVPLDSLSHRPSISLMNAHRW